MALSPFTGIHRAKEVEEDMKEGTQGRVLETEMIHIGRTPCELQLVAIDRKDLRELIC